MILFVDDLEQRYENFLKSLPWKDKAGTMWVATPELAASALLQFDFDEVWLDHDADTGSKRLMWRPGSDIPTFYLVAQFLAAMKFAGKVYIHTGNPAGAERMMNLLSDHGIEAIRPDGSTLSKIWGGVHP